MVSSTSAGRRAEAANPREPLKAAHCAGRLKDRTSCCRSIFGVVAMANNRCCPSYDLDVDDVGALWLGAPRLIIRGVIGQSVGCPPKILRVPACSSSSSSSTHSGAIYCRKAGTSTWLSSITRPRARLTVRRSWSRRGFLMISCSLPTPLHFFVIFSCRVLCFQLSAHDRAMHIHSDHKV